MREIGSEFWNVPITNKKNELFPESTQWFLSGRSALQAVINDIKSKKKCCTVALPSWCCDSMIKPFIDAGIEVHFYSVSFKNRIVQNIKKNCDILFVMDYFGYISDDLNLSDYYGAVIRDVTHSVFSKSYSDADYYFGSLRKWCGVWTGGFAWSNDGNLLEKPLPDESEYCSLRKESMEQKAEYIEGSRTDKNYLVLFKQAEELLDDINVVAADKRDVDLVDYLDVVFIRNQRRANAKVLQEAFPELLIFPALKTSECPLFVPVLIPDGKRDALRRYLINNSVYCPIHWPVSKYHVLNNADMYIYENELSLVCDQRYNEKDMNRMIELINTFMEK